MLSPELSWAAQPRQELLRLAWPIVVSLLSYALMTLIDTLFVSHLGQAALAGVGLGGVVAYAVLSFGFGLFRGVKVNVSQAHGAGHATLNHVSAGVLVAVVLGFLFLGIGSIIARLLPLVTATEASGQVASSYASIRLLSTPLVFVYVALREGRYGIGDSLGPMRAMVLANGVNIGLDVLFIFGFEWGIEGAALATILSQVVEVGVLIWRQRKAPLPRPRRIDIIALFRVGLPTGVQFVIEVGAFVLLTGLLAALSEREMAAHQIGIQVVHFAFLPMVAVSEAASVMAGQAVGAGRKALVHVSSRAALRLAMMYALGCFVVLLFFGGPIAALFTDDPALQTVTANLFIVGAIFQFGDAGNIVARGVLRGTGDVRYAAVVGVTAAWALTPPLTWLLGYHFGWGAVGGWLGLSLEITVCAVLLWRRLLSDKWFVAAERNRLALAKAAI